MTNDLNEVYLYNSRKKKKLQRKSWVSSFEVSSFQNVSHLMTRIPIGK